MACVKEVQTVIEYVAQNQLFPTLLGAQAVDADAMYRPISFCLLQTVDGAQVASTIIVPLFPPVPGWPSESPSSSLDSASLT